MPTFKMEKLVRDQVLERCLADPKAQVDYRLLDDGEFTHALITKLHEEADELLAAESSGNGSPEDILGEIADLRAVVDALQRAHGFSDDEVRQSAAAKAQKNGEFARRAYIATVTLAEDSEWIDYFRSKYEEVD